MSWIPGEMASQYVWEEMMIWYTAAIEVLWDWRNAIVISWLIGVIALGRHTMGSGYAKWLEERNKRVSSNR